MKLKQSSSSYLFSPFFVNFCALMAYAHINALWPSIRGSISWNLSVFYPAYVSSSIIYGYAISCICTLLYTTCMYRPHLLGRGTWWPGPGGPFSPLFPGRAAPRLNWALSAGRSWIPGLVTFESFELPTPSHNHTWKFSAKRCEEDTNWMQKLSSVSSFIILYASTECTSCTIKIMQCLNWANY